MILGRKRFLQAMFGAACGVALGDEVLDRLDRIAPRPVMVGGLDNTSVYGVSESTYPLWQTDAMPAFVPLVTVDSQELNRIWRKAQTKLIAGYNREITYSLALPR